jgi:hypothetical protein
MEIPDLSPFWPDRRFISSASSSKGIQIMGAIENRMAEAQWQLHFSICPRRTSYYLRNVRLLTISNYA